MFFSYDSHGWVFVRNIYYIVFGLQCSSNQQNTGKWSRKEQTKINWQSMHESLDVYINVRVQNSSISDNNQQFREKWCRTKKTDINTQLRHYYYTSKKGLTYIKTNSFNSRGWAFDSSIYCNVFGLQRS